MSKASGFNIMQKLFKELLIKDISNAAINAGVGSTEMWFCPKRICARLQEDLCTAPEVFILEAKI